MQTFFGYFRQCLCGVWRVGRGQGLDRISHNGAVIGLAEAAAVEGCVEAGTDQVPEGEAIDREDERPPCHEVHAGGCPGHGPGAGAAVYEKFYGEGGEIEGLDEMRGEKGRSGEGVAEEVVAGDGELEVVGVDADPAAALRDLAEMDLGEGERDGEDGR